MVCDRCIMTVRQVLNDLDYQVDSISLGSADIVEGPTEEERAEISKKLREKGFELIRQGDEVLVEEIKAKLIDYLQFIESDDNPPKLSDYLADQLHYNYSYLSNFFSSQTDSTIEQHFINLKIERVKELLTYDEMTLSEIAWKLNYSSVQYLSNQFKKVTGETVSSFRKHMNAESRQSLDSIR